MLIIRLLFHHNIEDVLLIIPITYVQNVVTELNIDHSHNLSSEY